MKKTLSFCALATLLTLAGCDGSAPSQKAGGGPNPNAPAPGSLENGDQKIKDALKSTDGAAAKAAVPPAAPKKP